MKLYANITLEKTEQKRPTKEKRTETYAAGYYTLENPTGKATRIRPKT